MRRNAADLRGSRLDSVLLAIGGQVVFACLVALAVGGPPAIEVTIAFGLALAFGLELQGRRALAQARAAPPAASAGRRAGDRR